MSEQEKIKEEDNPSGVLIIKNVLLFVKVGELIIYALIANNEMRELCKNQIHVVERLLNLFLCPKGTYSHPFLLFFRC